MFKVKKTVIFSHYNIIWSILRKMNPSDDVVESGMKLFFSLSRFVADLAVSIQNYG